MGRGGISNSKQLYQAEISNRFVALENLDESSDINNA
jgi:hypothetical protein